MLCNKDTAKDTGLNVWVDVDPNANGAEVDVIAVQGLGAHKYYTWVKKKSSATVFGSDFIPRRRRIAQTPEDDDTLQFSMNAARITNDPTVEVMWLRDLLPRSLPNARIATYSYKSDWRQDVKTNLRECGQQFLNVLYQHRSSEKEARRPLILIGHSLGGLVIKQALVLADHGVIFKDLRLSVVGIIFLGTPHQGSDAAGYGKLLAQATGRDTTLLESLTRNSQVLNEIAQDFEKSYSDADLVCFYEKNHGLLGVKFVDFQSASLNGKRSMYLSTDHSGLNKYHGFEDENFQLVLPEIQRMVQTAQITIGSRFESAASTTASSINPFRVNFSLRGIPVLNKFVARDAEMARLVEVMLPSSTDKTGRKICVLHGLGGIGKTQLAIEFARRHQQNYSAVRWIDGSSKQKLKQSIANLANQLPQHQLLERAKLYAQQPHEELDGAIEDVLSWFSQSSNEQWLLVYDNVDHEISAEINDPDAFNLREYLPEADQGSILITSRLTNLQHLGGLDLRVGPVSQLQGENILTSSVGEPVRDSEKLISLLQGLPLAINQAGAYIRTTGTSVLAYMKLYNEAWGKLMEAQHRFASHGSLDHSVLTTWTLLFRRLEEKNGNAAKLLLLWGFLDNRDIWYELFTPVLDRKITSELPSWYTSCVNDYFNFTECTQLLVLYSFIDTNIGLSSFSVHPVLHQWCYQASEDEMAEMAWLAFVLVASSAPENTIANYTLVQRRLLPHCDRLFSLVRETTAKAPFHGEELSLHEACHNIGRLYMIQGKFTEAEDMLVRALTGFEKDLGPEHISTFATVNALGALYRDQGKLREAEDMLVRALAGYGKALGPEHTSTLMTVMNLGLLYRDQGKLREAEDMLVRALTGKEKALGPEHTLTLTAVSNLGLLYSDQGKFTEAEDMLVRALAGYEKDLGPEHTSTLNTVNNLGLLYKNKGNLREAEDMYLRALAGYEKALGPEHSSTLDTVNALGILYRDQGKLRQAEDMYVRALAGYGKALGPEHTSTLRTVMNLGLLYRDQGKLREAEDMLVRALTGFEKDLGPEHISTFDTVKHLGALYRDQGKLREAEDMLVRALAGYGKALGPEHTSTLKTVMNLGLLYRDQGKLREAEDMFVRALTGNEKALGPEHTLTLMAVRNLGLLYSDQGKFTEAEDMFVRALAGYEKDLESEHTSTLDIVNNLGLLYRDQGKFRAAEDMFERTVTGFENALGPEHEKTVNARRIIANLKNPPKSKTRRIISKLFKHDKT